MEIRRRKMRTAYTEDQTAYEALVKYNCKQPYPP